MTLKDKFMQECIHRNLTTNEQKAKLIYDLVEANPYAQLYYEISGGHPFDQYRLCSYVTSSRVLIQATKNRNGRVQLSIQGLSCFGYKNFIDFFSPDEREIFLDHLGLFGD